LNAFSKHFWSRWVARSFVLGKIWVHSEKTERGLDETSKISSQEIRPTDNAQTLIEKNGSNYLAALGPILHTTSELTPTTPAL
jgi:hypothetical protein